MRVTAHRPGRLLPPAAALAGGLLLAASASAELSVVPAAHDNTLIESASGALSNGSGPHLFAGRTSQASGSIRRAALRFDVAGALPPGAVVLAAHLELHVSQSNAAPAYVKAHLLLADWGEGASSADGGRGAPAAPGDATWLHTFYPTSFWSSPGGDVAPAPSATLAVGGDGDWAFPSTPAVLDDVQAWLDDPASNGGWLLVGDESASSTVKRFDSRENPDPAVRPRLVVEWARGRAAACRARGLDGAARAACTAYCDALACDGPAPRGSVRACATLARQLEARTGGPFACDVPDADGDGVDDAFDFCPALHDPDQRDGDGDGAGDACDNCPLTPNPGQEDGFGAPGIGDACDCPCFSETEVQGLVLALQDAATYTGLACVDTRVAQKPLSAVLARRVDGAPCGAASHDCSALSVEFTEDRVCQLNPPAPAPQVEARGISDEQREACRQSLVSAAESLGLPCD
jgi:hypothetical protein